MNPNNPKILILSSDTGGGHRSAAAAIVAGIQSFVHGESYAIRTIRAHEGPLPERVILCTFDAVATTITREVLAELSGDAAAT